MIPKYQGGPEKTVIFFCICGVLDDTCGYNQSEGNLRYLDLACSEQGHWRKLTLTGSTFIYL